MVIFLVNKFNVYSALDLIRQAFALGVLYNIPGEIIENIPHVLFTLEDVRFETLFPFMTKL